MFVNKLFPTEKERNGAREKLMALQRSPNWRFLVERVIRPDIEKLSEEILDSSLGSKEEIDGVRDKKRRRAYMIILSQLPEKLVEALEDNKGEDVLFDPYFNSAKELKVGNSPQEQ